MDPKLITAMVFCVLGVVLTAGSLGSPAWYVSATASVGLFRSCVGFLCVSHEPIGDYHKVAAAFLIMALFAILASGGILLYSMMKKKTDLAKTGGGVAILAVVFVIVAMSPITARTSGLLMYGWGFGFGWAAFPVCLIAAIAAFLV